MSINYLNEHNGVEQYNVTLTLAAGYDVFMSDFFTLLNELESDGTLTRYQTDALYHAGCSYIHWGILPGFETFALPSGYYVPFIECVKYLFDHYVASPEDVSEIEAAWILQGLDIDEESLTRSVDTTGTDRTTLSDFLDVDPSVDDVECEPLIIHWRVIDDPDGYLTELNGTHGNEQMIMDPEHPRFGETWTEGPRD